MLAIYEKRLMMRYGPFAGCIPHVYTFRKAAEVGRFSHLETMDITKARTAYFAQKNNAKQRGIGWQFTFDTWLAWWGDDLDERGVGKFKLQMQRIADTGPYHPDNVRKGVPQQNSDTYSRMYQHRACRRARAAILKSEMDKPARPVEWEVDELTEDHKELLPLGFARTRAVYGL